MPAETQSRTGDDIFAKLLDKEKQTWMVVCTSIEARNALAVVLAIKPQNDTTPVDFISEESRTFEGVEAALSVVRAVIQSLETKHEKDNADTVAKNAKAQAERARLDDNPAPKRQTLFQRLFRR